MVVNHIDNQALYLCTINREHNKPLTDKMHECFGLLQQIQNRDVSGKLYLAICDAVDIAEDYAFDKAAELQSAITADELTRCPRRHEHQHQRGHPEHHRVCARSTRVYCSVEPEGAGRIWTR